MRQPAHDPVQRLNEHHADDLLALARTLGGHPDAASARAEHVGPTGVDLVVDSPHGRSTTHIDFVEPAAGNSELRLAFRALAAVARATTARGERNAP